MFQVLHISFMSNIYISYSVVAALDFVSTNPTVHRMNALNAWIKYVEIAFEGVLLMQLGI